MMKFFLRLFAVLITSFFFFPFEFTFLPGINTKLVMAVIGVLLLAYDAVCYKNVFFTKNFASIFSYALLVSLIGFISVVINGTNDHNYATYVVSMLVWLSAAYVTTSLIKKIHGYISVELICNYLIIVCVVQCIIAILIEFNPFFKSLIELFSIDFIGKVDNRLYGIGCGIDIAGTRFSCVLIMIAYLICSKLKTNFKVSEIILYLIAYFIIVLIGNMIGRTTTLGVVISLLYLIFCSGIFKTSISQYTLKFWMYFFVLLFGLILIVLGLYNFDVKMKNFIEFAFEGFFSLEETGKWDVSSNEILLNMYVFPDNFKTWIIGDGYFDNPTALDATYVGKRYGGFYMGTDVGYLRFIFYFGVIGLVAFILFFISVYNVCKNKFKQYKNMFLLILICNFIIWLKVSTDIFLVFALFVSIENTITSVNNNVELQHNNI